MAPLNEISPRQLGRLIGTPDCPALVDLRIPEDLAQDPRRVPSAFCHDDRDIDGLAARLAQCGGTGVLYCHGGLKISQGAAALLRGRGVKAEVLEGGHLAWKDAGLPLVDLSALPERRPTRWVTRHRPKVDRIACPWLIRRFVDPQAEILFVAPTHVMAVAERFDAVPFDVPTARFTHEGDLCSFDVLLSGLDLTSPALLHLARLVRAADTNQHGLAPEAAGLLAASLGLSRMYREDHQQMEAGLMLYDMFYRWARDAVDESHDSHDRSQGRGAWA